MTTYKPKYWVTNTAQAIRLLVICRFVWEMFLQSTMNFCFSLDSYKLDSIVFFHTYEHWGSRLCWFAFNIGYIVSWKLEPYSNVFALSWLVIKTIHNLFYSHVFGWNDSDALSLKTHNVEFWQDTAVLTWFQCKYCIIIQYCSWEWLGTLRNEDLVRCSW